MTTAYSGDGITFPDSTVQATAPRVGMVNRIINGDMRIDQRNAGASVTANNDVFGVDRFQYSVTQSNKGTLQQSSTTPTGFSNSLLFTSSSAYSIGAGDIFVIRQHIEGFNVADFGWGTASAATVTLSFWVRSSLTGTFGGSLLNASGGRAYPFTYTISNANTFEYKTITIAGDTSGTWLTTNGRGITLIFGLGVGSTYSATAGAWGDGSYISSATGSTSVVGTSGATWYVTGVQLEKGSTATDFEYVDYGRQLIQCQRYYESNFPLGTAPAINQSFSAADMGVIAYAGTAHRSPRIMYKVVKRAYPTVVLYSPAGYTGLSTNKFTVYISSLWRDWTGGNVTSTNTGYFGLDGSSPVSVTIGYSYLAAGNWAASAEL